jgi:ligand-binding sensor domain-containing protein
MESDSKGNIWIGTIEGVCIYDGKSFSYFPLPEGIKDTTMGVSSTKMIHDILEDNDGTIWISSNAGLFSYSNRTLTHLSEKAGIHTNFVNQLFSDSSGDLWISAKDGLYHLTDNKAQNITRGHIQMGKGIGSIAEDKDGTIWFVANQHDLYTYDGRKVSKFQKPEENKGPVVFQIFKDQDERLWFVGFGGAYRLENGEFLHITKDGPW